MKTLPIAAALALTSLVIPCRGDVPDTITHQGRITVNGVNFNGPGGMKFAIYEAPAPGDPSAIARWKNNNTNPVNMSQPPVAVLVSVDQGLYSLALGDTSLTNMAALPASLDPNLPGNKLYLRIWFNDGTHGFQELSPDQELRSVIFARHAEDAATAESAQTAQSAVTATTADSALSVPAGTIDNTMLANNSVTADKIVDNSISEDQLEAEGVAESLSSLGAGIVSQDPNAGPLLSAGYIRLGEISRPSWETIPLGIEPPTARSGHSLVWTGTHVIMWGGLDDSLNRLNDGFKFDFATNQWSPISAVNAPSPRLEHTAVWTGTHMLVWGGLDVTDELRDGGIYDPATDTWSALPAAPAALGKRAKHTAIWTGSHMVVYGGTDLDLMAGHTYHDNGAAFNPSSGNWSMLPSANAPIGRERHAMIWTGSKMIVWGGLNGTNFSIDDGGIYDPSTNSWTSLPGGTPNAPAGRFYHSGVWTGSEMVIWGGFVNGTGDVADGAAYDPATGNWRTLAAPPAALTARQRHTGTWTGSEMVIVGGDGTFPTEHPVSAAAYDPAGDSWRSLPDAGVRKEFPAVWSGSSLFLFGGKDTAGTPIATAQYWVEASNLWLEVAAALAPTARQGHVVEWTGSKLIVWGGLDATYTNTGGIFNPNTGGWSDLPTAGAPPGLWLTEHCWTGTEMIVWGGGQSGDSTSASGGRYNPTTETWSSISPTGAPTGRAGHTGVWTGTQFIIWGGVDHTGNVDTGARYNPGPNTWSSMSTVNAPSPRNNHTAIWTGTEMIVWGGEDATELQDGGRYNPATNSWSTLTITNAPDARGNHTAVWTGSEMIVWGGFTSGVGRSRTGGRYDPVTDSWTATGDPGYGNRNDHSATWTGSEMLIWGGLGVYEFGSVDGMLYDPTTDSWRPAPTDGAPSTRSFFGSAWTGDRLAVWGGTPTGSSLETDTGAFLNLNNKLYIYVKP